MSQVTLDIAEAVVAAINAAVTAEELTFTITAALDFAPTFDLENQQPLRVTVTPAGETVTASSRGDTDHEHEVHVAIFKRLDEAESFTTYLDFAQEVRDLFPFVAMAGHAWIGIDQTPLYDPQLWRDSRGFMTVVSLRYREIRDRTA